MLFASGGRPSARRGTRNTRAPCLGGGGAALRAPAEALAEALADGRIRLLIACRAPSALPNPQLAPIQFPPIRFDPTTLDSAPPFPPVPVVAAVIMQDIQQLQLQQQLVSATLTPDQLPSDPPPASPPAPLADEKDFKSRYILSLETQLASAERLSNCEAATIALQKDVVLLRAEVQRLAAAVKASRPPELSHSLSKINNSLSPEQSPLPATRIFPRATRQSLLTRQSHSNLQSNEIVQQASGTSISEKPNKGTKPEDSSVEAEEESDAILEPLEFSSAPPAFLTNGEPNVLGYRAWTDIVRIRYPNFQRVTPAMSKAARFFREAHSIELVRLVARTSLKSNVTLAIPAQMHAKFLKYMEELFVQGTSGFFGDKNTEPFSSSPQIPGATAAAAALAIASSSSSLNFLASTSGSSTFPGSSAVSSKRKELGSSETVDFKRIKRTGNAIESAAASAERMTNVFETGHTDSSDMQYDLKKAVISKNGVRLIKYNIILAKIMKDFKNLPKEARVAIKKGVKSFLQHELKDQFEDCVITSDEPDKANTYGVPEGLLNEFKTWACSELQRCFPKLEVGDANLL
ncbi:hypothetical protein HDU83_008052 [Entophlyctis luteolus]|nr:hypothetical protein HDU83_008052 [Entophlyctis luteolus]KAJ3394456.1 hypothetical protein HDU84_008452 [Entophlyctis sp. JEL0112]